MRDVSGIVFRNQLLIRQLVSRSYELLNLLNRDDTGIVFFGDVSNRIARMGMGGQFYRITVVCGVGGAADGGISGRQTEVEYLVRFGL